MELNTVEVTESPEDFPSRTNYKDLSNVTDRRFFIKHRTRQLSSYSHVTLEDRTVTGTREGSSVYGRFPTLYVLLCLPSSYRLVQGVPVPVQLIS